MAGSGVDVFRLGDLVVGPGQLGRGALTVAWERDGSPVNLPLLVAHGAEPGPTLLLTAGMHGIEVGGCEVVRQVLRERSGLATRGAAGGLELSALRGTVIAAPVLNPFAFRAAEMSTPEDELNLNRVFPGSATGLTSHRLAHAIMTELVARADYLIDLHSNVVPALAFTIVKPTANREVEATSRAMAEAFRLTTIELRLALESHRTGTLMEAALALGKPGITIELIGTRTLEPTSIEAGVRGTFNVLRALGLLAGELEAQTTVRVLSGRLTRTEVTVSRGGILHQLVPVGGEVRRGEVFAHLRDPWGDVVEELRSPVDGWVLAYPLRMSQAVLTGNYVAFLAFGLT